jgi:hypothetical protein
MGEIKEVKGFQCTDDSIFLDKEQAIKHQKQLNFKEKNNKLYRGDVYWIINLMNLSKILSRMDGITNRTLKHKRYGAS